MKEVIFSCARERAGASEISLPVGKKPRIESDRLFQGGSEIVLHQNEEYSLRITRNGKLILTK